MILGFFILFNLFLIIPIIIYGLALKYINRESYRNITKSSMGWVYRLCGYIGIPIHEFCHFIMALIFGTQITEIVWYDPNWTDDDESMGHVSYLSNPESLYHHIGHFFIGIAPMIGGCAIIYGLIRLLLPNTYSSLAYLNFDNFNIFTIISEMYSCINHNIQLIFSNSDGLLRTIIFFVLAFSISICMDVSPADIKLAKEGIIMVEIFLFIVSIFLYFYKFTALINIIFIIASYLYFFLTLGIIFSLISLIFSFVIRII